MKKNHLIWRNLLFKEKQVLMYWISPERRKMDSILHPAHSQHLFCGIPETEKPENTGFKGCELVEAAGVEPASENNQPRLLHTYLKIYYWLSCLL